jgi:hypothetical protein
MGQFESFHIQKYMRIPEESGESLDEQSPLRYVPRTADKNGRQISYGPRPEHAATYWPTLVKYLTSLDSVLAKLNPIVQSIAIKNTVVVLVCNHGQSEILMNFICNARSRGLDLTPVLVFATDPETRDLAEGLGVTAFYDEINYGGIPLKAAKQFADSTFAAVVLAKVYCVHMISMLGYDILFQDVDVTWYRNPLEFFHNTSSPEANYDMIFQDDGGRDSNKNAPWSVNAGFFYVRYNRKTQNLLNSYLFKGDAILTSRTLQSVLGPLLQEHASLHGLRIKTLH